MSQGRLRGGSVQRKQTQGLKAPCVVGTEIDQLIHDLVVCVFLFECALFNMYRWFIDTKMLKRGTE